MIHYEHITEETVLQKHGEDALPHGKSYLTSLFLEKPNIMV
jgi:hypothetical protein